MRLLRLETWTLDLHKTTEWLVPLAPVLTAAVAFETGR